MNARVTLEQQEDFHFAIRFGDAIPLLHSDEHPPLGKGAGPSPDQLLAAAVGNCMSASLLFALRKFKQAPEPIRTEVEATTGRNEANRLRIQRIAVRITLGVPAAGAAAPRPRARAVRGLLHRGRERAPGHSRRRRGLRQARARG